MPLEPPNLDDRTFEDIFDELKSLIPRYTPEWTDHNEHDPGITLFQLFSYLSEIMIYRLNKVPEKNYIEFIRLIGEELKPAEPARTDLTFTLKVPDIDASTKTVIIPKGTQVTAKGENGKEILFETEIELNSFAASIKKLVVYDTTGHVDETSALKTPNTFFYAFGENPKIGSMFYVGFDRAIPPNEAVKIHIDLFTQDLPSPGAHCTLDERFIFPSVSLSWEYWNGSSYSKLNVLHDETWGLTRSGDLHFISPAMQYCINLPVDTDDEKVFWIRCILDEGHYEITPRIELIQTNVVCASNAVTVRNEVLGESNNMPNQVFTLRNHPIIPGTLVLQVDEGHGFKTWTEVVDFNVSRYLDRHYVLKRENGSILFGDGIHGIIPPGGNKNNIKGLTYRYGGGEGGNLPAGKITDLKSTITEVDKVTNLKASTGGRDEETLEDIKRRVPRELKTRNRAVTNEDFEKIALDTPFIRVARAKALPLYHPDYPGIEIPGAVTVVVVPYSEEKKPYPSENFIKTVCYHLNKHRLLTTELHVMAPCYEEISVEASITADFNYGIGKVKLEVLNVLEKFFNPLKGGPDGTGWEFGRNVDYFEVCKQMKIKGVSQIDNVVLKKNGNPFPECKNVDIAENSLVYSGEHTITVQ